MKEKNISYPLKCHLIYAGPREYAAGVRYVFFKLEDLSMNDGSTLLEMQCDNFISDKKMYTSLYIGGIYPVTYDDATHITYHKKGLAVAQWKNKDDLIKWKSIEVSMQELKSLENTIKENQLIKAMQPVKDAYRKAGTLGKRQLLAEVIRIVTT